MAKDIEIKIKVVNESGNVVEKTAKSMKDLEDAVAGTSKALQTAPLGSAKFKELDSALKENQKTLDKTKASTQGLGETLGNIKGPVGGAIQGLMGLGKAAMAFVTNPIGAVIALLGIVFTAVSAAMKKSEAAMDAVTKVTAIFGAIIQPIITFIQEVAVYALEKLAAGLEEVASWFGISGEEAGNLADSMDAVDDAEKNLAVTRAKTNQQLAEAREILSDTNASYEERVAALKKVQAAEGAQSAQEVANAKQKLINAQLFLAAHKGEEEAIQAVRDATIELANIEQDAAANGRKLNQQQKQLDSEKDAAAKQILADQKVRNDKAAADAKARRDTALAADKVAIEKRRQYEEEFTLSQIKNEDQRAIIALKYRQAREIAELTEQIHKIAIIKNKTDEERKLYSDLVEQRISQKQLQKSQLEALETKQQENIIAFQKDFNIKTDELILANTKNQLDALKLKDDAITKSNQTQLETQTKLLQDEKITQQEFDAWKKANDEKDRLYRIEFNNKTAKILLEETQKAFEEAQGYETSNTKKKLAILEVERNDILTSFKLSEETKTALLEKNTKRRTELEDAHTKKVIDNVNLTLAITQAALNSITELTIQNQTNELKANDKKYKDLLKQVEGNAKATTEIQKQQLAEGNKIKEAAFNNNKKLQYATAVINGAVAVGSIIAQYPKFDGGFAMIAALAVAGIALATSLAKISSTNFTPDESSSSSPTADTSKVYNTYADGGYVSGAGTSTSDSIPARLSNGESVINARSTAMYGGLLSMINELGGGKAFAGGGVANQSMDSGRSYDLPIIKTYVVASDMTSQQEADRRIKQLAQL